MAKLIGIVTPIVDVEEDVDEAAAVVNADTEAPAFLIKSRAVISVPLVIIYGGRVSIDCVEEDVVCVLLICF